MIFLILLNLRHLSLAFDKRLKIFNLPTNIVIADSNILVHDHLKILGVIIDKPFTFVLLRVATIIIIIIVIKIIVDVPLCR